LTPPANAFGKPRPNAAKSKPLVAAKNFYFNMNTPETDHLENELGSAAKFSHPVIWRHARQLERERNEAREEVRLLKAILDLIKKEAQ